MSASPWTIRVWLSIPVNRCNALWFGMPHLTIASYCASRASSASVVHMGANANTLSGHGLVSSSVRSCGPPLSAYRILTPSITRNCGVIDAVSEVFKTTPSEPRRPAHVGSSVAVLLRNHIGGIPVGPVVVIGFPPLRPRGTPCATDARRSAAARSAIVASKWCWPRRCGLTSGLSLPETASHCRPGP